ncbi:restriction endonuclease subunit S, partial [Escherichia coli]
YNSPLGKTKFPLAPISDGCTFISGYAFKSKDFTGIGHPVIKIKNIQDGFVILEDSQCVDSKTVEGLNKFKLNNGDILIAMTGQGSVGRVGRLTFDGKKTPYLNQRVGKFIADEKKLNISYLYYILTTQQYQNILFNNASGSGQPNLSPAVIQSTLIPYPEYHLQCEIAKILDTINNRIIKSYAINITLEQMSQTLFKSWFVDFDPVIDNALDAGNPIPEALQARAELRQKVRNSVDFKPLSAEIRSLFPSEFEETELGWVPKGWSFTALKNFGKIICGKTPTKSNKNYYGEDFLFIKIPDMHGKVFVTNSHDKLSKLGSESQSNKIIPHGSICVSCIATVGLVSINAQDCHTNQQINSIVPNSPHYRNYLYFSMLEKYKIFHDLASGGSATLNMNTSVFSNIATLMPNNLVLKQFHKITEPWFEAILLNEYKLTSLASLRDTLLPKLISGELSLEDLPDLTTNTEAA